MYAVSYYTYLHRLLQLHHFRLQNNVRLYWSPKYLQRAVTSVNLTRSDHTVFITILRINSDHLPKQNWPADHCSGCAVCYPWEINFSYYIEEIGIPWFKGGDCRVAGFKISISSLSSHFGCSLEYSDYVRQLSVLKYVLVRRNNTDYKRMKTNCSW